MRTVILTAKQDEMSGELGWCIPGLKPSDIVNASSEGIGIAHDLLEHMNGASEIGGIDDELEALGAIWFVRGQTGQLRRDRIGSAYTPHENIGSDIGRMFWDHHAGGQYVDLNAPRTKACDADTDFLDIIQCGENWARDEADGHDMSPGEIAEPLRAYLAVCLPRLRIGYRKAVRKYRGESWRANAQFWAICDALERYKRPGFEGAQLRLVYGNEGATAEEYYPEDDYT